MAKLLPLVGINVTARVSNDKEIRNKGGYELALIQTAELTTRDWNDILQGIQEIVAVDIKQYEETGPLGTQIDYQKLLTECAEIKGWRSVKGSILLALEPSNNGNKGALESDFRRGLQINLFNNLPMTMPSLVNESLRHAAIERAMVEIDDSLKPIITFVENTIARKRPENLTFADSGMVTAQETLPDETILAIQPEAGTRQEENLQESIFPTNVNQGNLPPVPSTPVNTDNEDEEGENDSSHVFTSGGHDDDFSENSDDTITALRNEVTILKTENKQANFRIRSQERLIEDITQASEEQGTQLERELLDKTQAIYSLEKERRNDDTVHMVAIDQLQSRINQLKGENSGLNELIKRVNGHERNVDRVQSQLNNRIASIASEETKQHHGKQVGSYQFIAGLPSNNISSEKLNIPTSFSSLPTQDDLPTAPTGRLIIPKSQSQVRNDDLPIAVRHTDRSTLGLAESEIRVQPDFTNYEFCTPTNQPFIPEQSFKPSRLQSRRLTRNFLEYEQERDRSPLRRMASTHRKDFDPCQHDEEREILFPQEKSKIFPPTQNAEQSNGKSKQNSNLRLYVNDREVRKPAFQTNYKTERKTGKN